MLKSFRIGGIHPPENKLSAGKNIQTAALPKQAVILLGQHIGAPDQVVVKWERYWQKPEVLFPLIFTLLFPEQ